MVCCPKLHDIFYLSILEIKRLGDIDLAGKLNNADLCHAQSTLSDTFFTQGPEGTSAKAS